MILADTGIWIDHIRGGDTRLDDLLMNKQICMHAFVVAELMLGSLSKRADWLTMLRDLRALPTVTTAEVLALIERRRLYARGIGFVDVALLASCLLVPGTQLWTRDRRLAEVAADLGIAA